MSVEPGQQPIETALDDRPLDAAVGRAARAWRRLGKRLLATTPSALARALLVLGAGAALVWLFITSWPAPAPFIAGGLIAYALLPVVNRLDRLMPRPVAALLTTGAIFAAIVAFLMLLTPAVLEELVRLFQALPSIDDMRAIIAQKNAFIDTLPEPVQTVIRDELRRVSAEGRANLNLYVGRLLGLALMLAASALGALGFLLGLLVIPTWILSVLTDARAGARAINRLLPNWLEADFWAIARILDRALGGFIRGQVLIAFVVGGLTFLGLRLLERLGWPDMRYEVLLAIFAGLLQLIPTFGVVLNLGLGTLAGLSHSSEMALAVLLVYLAVHWLVGAFITPRLTRRVVAIHPAVLVLVLVALGQLGIFWVLLAAPVAAIARDLFRYAYGRFGEPARPPGLLPSGPVLPLPDPLPATATETAAARRVPLAYRQRALRRTGGGS